MSPSASRRSISKPAPGAGSCVAVTNHRIGRTLVRQILEISHLFGLAMAGGLLLRLYETFQIVYPLIGARNFGPDNLGLFFHSEIAGCGGIGSSIARQRGIQGNLRES